MKSFWFRSVTLACLTCLPVCGQAAEDDLPLLEERAMRHAVERVTPSVVRIETVGGLERVGELQFGEGPTTGLVVTADGYIISSAFNFLQKPTSILVSLHGGKRAAAKLVATDHNRMLVLLKVDVDEPLAVPESAPTDEIQVGQWAIAVGRTFESDAPNLSIGIVSARNRIWGKAIQTDAKISPSNYGGPLVDIRGRVLGVLVPMSPAETQVVAGVEWYDSGIGFAVPLEHIMQALPRLKEGNDLHPGQMGIGFRGGDQYADPAVIATSRPNSPAFKADLKAGDKIVEVNGRPIVRQTEVKEAIGPLYAGDKVKLVIARGEERLNRELELVQTVAPYERPFLGFLPRRESSGGPLTVRYVYPDSPAAGAGIQSGDVIVLLNNEPIVGWDDLADKIASLDPEKSIELAFDRSDERMTAELTPGSAPKTVPSELPAAYDEPASAERRPPVGRIDVKVAEFQNECFAYIPEEYHPEVPHGLLVWLSADGTYEADKVLKRFKALCDQYDLILLAPRTVEPQDARQRRRWDPRSDAEFISKGIEQLRNTYRVDSARIVAQGYQGGGAMAYVLGFGQRELIRGVVAVEAPLTGKAPDNEPAHRLAFYLPKATGAPSAKFVEAAEKRLGGMKYSVVVHEIGAAAHDLTEEEQSEVMRWIDTLDRL